MGTELEPVRTALRRITDGELDERPAAAPFAFRCSRTEISLQAGNARVRHSETRFEEGSLVTEEREGVFDGATYYQAVEQSQRMFLEQMRQAMRLFLRF